MKKRAGIHNVIRLILEYMVAISFILGTFTNIISFYLTGNNNELIRKIISQGLTFIITLCVVIYTLRKWFYSNAIVKKKIFLCFIPLALNGAAIAVAVFSASDKASILKNLLSWGSYCVALVCSAIYIKSEEKFVHVISKMKYLAGIMTPFWCVAIYYYWRLPVTAAFSKGIGGLTHLSIGYSAVIIYSFLISDFSLAIKRNAGSIVHYSAIVFEVIICSLVAVMSGGRGALIAWGGTSVIAILIFLIKKERKAISCILVGGMAIVVFCTIAPADNASLNRQFSFIAEIKNGDMTRSLRSEEGQKLLSEIYSKADEQQEISDIVKEISDNYKSQAQQNSDDIDGAVSPSDMENAEQYQDVIFSVTNGSMARIYLWQLAIKELRQRPLFGMGPVGFQIKYKTYPHNILLECLSDFGLPIGILFIGICVVTVVLIIRYSLFNQEYISLMIILTGPAIRAMLSGSLYSCEFLLFAFAVVIWQLAGQAKSGAKSGTEKSAV